MWSASVSLIHECQSPHMRSQKHCHLALDWSHSVYTRQPSPRFDSVLVDKSFGSNLKD